MCCHGNYLFIDLESHWCVWQLGQCQAWRHPWASFQCCSLAVLENILYNLQLAAFVIWLWLWNMCLFLLTFQILLNMIMLSPFSLFLALSLVPARDSSCSTSPSYRPMMKLIQRYLYQLQTATSAQEVLSHVNLLCQTEHKQWSPCWPSLYQLVVLYWLFLPRGVSKSVVLNPPSRRINSAASD